MKERTGNILNLNHGILVHSCDDMGGAHSALLEPLRARYPGSYRTYKQAFDAGSLTLGRIESYAVPSPTDDILVVVPAVMQRGEHVDLDAVQSCFLEVAKLARARGLPVHVPVSAGGDWPAIAERIQATVGADVEVHAWQSA